MISSSDAYRAAITSDARRILLRAVVDIVDPDLTYGDAAADSEAPWSKPEQLHDKVFNLDTPPYITLERGRWILGSGAKPIPEDNSLTGQVGYVGDALSNENGDFPEPVWVEQRFSNVSILQACSIYFNAAATDGWPVDFTVEISQGGVVYYTKTYTGNTAKSVSLSGFTVYDPDTIRVTVRKWSLPFRRMRVVEILPGIYETWDNSVIGEFDVTQQGNFSCLALPYGTCTLSMDNAERRFEPRYKDGIFKSIDERQGIEIYIGVKLPDGSTEYKQLGIYYQYDDGWKTSDNNLTMQWYLVDIIGLIADRVFLVPDTLPTTLEGWVAALVAQLGDNFADRYTVDPGFASMSLMCSEADVTDKRCGDILRWACMATGTWPRAASDTGNLTVEPFWHQGEKYTLDNLTEYPVMRSNKTIAALIFTLNDGNNTQYVVSGNSTSASSTVQIQNPFIKTAAAALTAARQILSTYGGNQIELVGRGDPASEIGDVDTVWLDETEATTARRMMQTFRISDGVLADCQSTLLQADGSFMFEETEVITADGIWTAPAGVSELRIIVVDGGQGGVSGTDGSYSKAGTDGADGAGGRVWAGTININEQQEFSVQLGHGGSDGAEGGTTTFGAYSGANGSLYPLGYTDIASGNSYGRTGVKLPAANSGDGGAGGKGGRKGNRHYETVKDYTCGGTLPDDPSNGVYIEQIVEVIDNEPGKGTKAAPGASGCVVVYWDKEAT